ncbi:hypothetical protein cgR_5017 [Corynebacterium glutamicum R]|uniref:Uncharacterized protein n=1 Tax=Corynebacterium glutamicum (strain R) TaxID=340322 RepID=A0AB72VA44_CORGB|nr:hypothetical protein cgR_5017 [Corynebacterium glutamicum R]
MVAVVDLGHRGKNMRISTTDSRFPAFCGGFLQLSPRNMQNSVRFLLSRPVCGESLISKHPGFTSAPLAPKCRPPRITFKGSKNINPDTDPFGIAQPLKSPSTTRRQEPNYPTTSSIFTPRARPCSTAQARSFLSKSVVRYSGIMNGPSM